MNNKTTLIAIVLGVVVLGGSFLAVFGSSLKNLKVEDSPVTVDESVTVPAGGTVSKPEGTVVKDEDDSESDDDDVTVTPTPTTKPPVSNPSTGTTGSSYTLTQISTHNSATSCWSAINGEVYDLTRWVDGHPGGRAAILMICGKDGSPVFNLQHGGQRKPATILINYKIGSLSS